MHHLVPDLPDSSFEMRVLRIATENLLDLEREGAEDGVLDLELETALQACSELPAYQACAVLLRNVVERLLLLDHSLAVDLAKHSDLADRARVEAQALNAVGLLRDLGEAGQATAPGSWAELQALFLPTSEGGASPWERALILPGLAGDAERRNLLDRMERALALDSDVVAIAKDSHAPVRPVQPSRRAPRRARWTVPTTAPRLGLEVRRAARLGSEQHELGEKLLVRLDPVQDAGMRPVVVREVAGEARVVFPTASRSWRPLDAFAQDAGGFEIPVNLLPPPGTHRYLVALVPLGFRVDWTAPESDRWAQLQADLSAGRCAAEEFEVRVQGRSPSPTRAPRSVSMSISEEPTGWVIRLDGGFGGPVEARLEPAVAAALAGRVRAVQETLAVSTPLGLARDAEWSAREAEIGQVLAEVLGASSSLWTRFDRLLRGAQDGVSLHLTLDGERLHALPWELLASGPDAPPLALQHGCSVTRRTRRSDRPAPGGPVRMLRWLPDPTCREGAARLSAAEAIRSAHGLPEAGTLSRQTPAKAEGSIVLHVVIASGRGLRGFTRWLDLVEAGEREAPALLTLDVAAGALSGRSLASLLARMSRMDLDAALVPRVGTDAPASWALYDALYRALADGATVAQAVERGRRALADGGRPEAGARWHEHVLLMG